MRTESKGKPGCSKDGNMTNASQATQREDWPEVVWAPVQKGQKWTTLQPTQTNSNKQRGIIDAHPEQSKLRRWDQVNRCFSPWTLLHFTLPRGYVINVHTKAYSSKALSPPFPQKGRERFCCLWSHWYPMSSGYAPVIISLTAFFPRWLLLPKTPNSNTRRASHQHKRDPSLGAEQKKGQVVLESISFVFSCHDFTPEKHLLPGSKQL